MEHASTKNLYLCQFFKSPLGWTQIKAFKTNLRGRLTPLWLNFSLINHSINGENVLRSEPDSVCKALISQSVPSIANGLQGQLADVWSDFNLIHVRRPIKEMYSLI